MGVNYLDFYTADPEVRSSVGRVLKEVPGHFVLQGHLCSVWQNGQYKRTREIQEVKEGFADLLERLNVPSLDAVSYTHLTSTWSTTGPWTATATPIPTTRRWRTSAFSPPWTRWLWTRPAWMRSTIPRTAAVSYTPLDVYKRQVYKMARRL